MFANELYAIELPVEDVAWDDAACRVADTSMIGLFFSEQIDDIARAKDICSSCDIRQPCLEGALARREPWGVWGGQLFVNGKILAQKRKRGRPPKVRPVEVGAGEVARAQSA